jgi:plastocyanin
MELLHGSLGLAPQLLADILPDWLERLDGANAVIGFVTLIAGLLGLAYFILAMIATPQPRTEPAESSAYPGIDKFVVPLLLPVGVVITVALIILFTSQILLAVPEAIATPIALAIALFILVACGIVATAGQVRRGAIYTLIGVPLVVLIIAGSVAGIYRVQQAQQEAAIEAQREANAPLTSLSMVTTDDAFSKTHMISPAGQQITITLSNKGASIHNWHVLDVKDDSGKDIATALTNPGSTSTDSFTISTPGTYKFQCDVHPTQMFGTLVIQ